MDTALWTPLYGPRSIPTEVAWPSRHMHSTTLNISVRLLSGAEERFEVDRSTRLGEFKSMLEKRLGHPSAAQRLFLGSTRLTNRALTFDELEIHDGFALTLLVVQPECGAELSDDDVPMSTGIIVKESIDEEKTNRILSNAGSYRWDDGTRNSMGGIDQFVLMLPWFASHLPTCFRR